MKSDPVGSAAASSEAARSNRANSLRATCALGWRTTDPPSRGYHCVDGCAPCWTALSPCDDAAGAGDGWRYSLQQALGFRWRAGCLLHSDGRAHHAWAAAGRRRDAERARSLVVGDSWWSARDQTAARDRTAARDQTAARDWTAAPEHTPKPVYDWEAALGEAALD
jgi:hypothetical protein